MKKITHKILHDFYESQATDVKTLDVGSASGRNKEFFPNSVTVDFDKESKPDFVADAHDLPFSDSSFGCVVCKEVLEHVHEPQVVIDEMYRVLEPGGKVVLSTRFLFPIHEAPHDHWRFTRYSLERLFNKWTNVEVKEESDPITSIIILLHRLIYQSDFKFNKPTKGLILLLSYVFIPFKPLLIRQYGDVGKTKLVDSAFTSGYHVVAYK